MDEVKERQKGKTALKCVLTLTDSHSAKIGLAKLSILNMVLEHNQTISFTCCFFVHDQVKYLIFI